MGARHSNAPLAIVLAFASLMFAASTTAQCAEVSKSTQIANTVSDFVQLRALRDLIAQRMIVHVRVSFDNGNGSLSDFGAAVAPGSDATGRSFFDVAKSQLPESFEGYPVKIVQWRRPAIPLSEREVSQAIKALSDLISSDGLRGLLASGWLISTDVDFTAPPPELQVAGSTQAIPGSTNPRSGSIYGQSLERDIPAVFEGFPVRVDASAHYAYGTLKSRPGRARFQK